MVKGRWLKVEPYSTSSMISDGIDHENPRSYLRMNSFFSTTLLDGEKRCQSIYGFLPCADTMPEGMFLMIMYMYLMMLAEDWIRSGSQALFLLLGDVAIGASVFRLLMGLPRIVLVFVTGVVATQSAAQNQVAFRMSMYAGSTLITLTFIWGFRIILSRDKLRGKDDKHHSSTNGCWSLTKHKLSLLNDIGVNIDKGTGDIAVIMLLSLIPFTAVELAALVNSPTTVLFALVVSGVSLVLYIVYQIGHPWIQARSLAYLKQEHLRTRFIFHLQRLAEDDLIDEHGMPKDDAFRRCFDDADDNGDGYISHDELERLIKDKFKLEQDNISMEYAKAEILTHFDHDKNGRISLSEFTKGCTMWLEKWKEDASNSNSIHINLLKQAEKLVIRNKREDLTKIEIIMPRILKQVLEKRGLVKDNKPDREKIEECVMCTLDIFLFISLIKDNSSSSYSANPTNNKAKVGSEKGKMSIALLPPRMNREAGSGATPSLIVVLHQTLDIRHITLSNKDIGRLVYVLLCLSAIKATT